MTEEQQSLQKFLSYINNLRGMSLIAENIWLLIAYYSTRMGRKKPSMSIELPLSHLSAQ